MPSGIGFHSNEPPCHSVDFAKSRVDFAERHSQQFDVTLTSPVTVFWERIEITCQEGFDVAAYGCITIIISSWKGLSGLSCRQSLLAINQTFGA